MKRWTGAFFWNPRRDCCFGTHKRTGSREATAPRRRINSGPQLTRGVHGASGSARTALASTWSAMSTQAQATEGRVHYSRAPILEAVIDIHARLPHDVDLEALSRVSWGVAGGRYSSPQPRFRNDILVQGDSQPPVVSAAQVQVGFIFRDDERKQVVQSRIDGFALSQLAPYDRWESFCHDARFLWDAYCDAARPLGVTRIAVRYINRLELPHPLEDFR